MAKMKNRMAAKGSGFHRKILLKGGSVTSGAGADVSSRLRTAAAGGAELFPAGGFACRVPNHGAVYASEMEIADE